MITKLELRAIANSGKTTKAVASALYEAGATIETPDGYFLTPAKILRRKTLAALAAQIRAEDTEVDD